MNAFQRLLKEVKPLSGYLLITAVAIVALTGLDLLVPELVRQLLALTETGGSLSTASLATIALSLLGLYLLKILFRFLSGYTSHVASWNLVTKMRTRLYDHMQMLPMDFFRDKQTGQLMSMITNGVRTFEDMIAHAIPGLLANALVVIGVVAILFGANSRLAALTLIPVPLLVVATRVFAVKARPLFTEVQVTEGDFNGVLQDNFAGLREIRLFNRQAQARERFHEKSRIYMLAMLRVLRMGAIFHPFAEFLTSVGKVGVIFFGGLLALQGKMRGSDIVSFMLYLDLFYNAVAALAKAMEDVTRAYAGCLRVYRVLDLPPAIEDEPGSVRLVDCKGQLVFQDVSFGYADDRQILEKISFTARPGQVVALVGPTGVGKSSIIKLITRFYDPTQGSISIDGQDIRNLAVNSLREQIAVVPQDVFLFSGTIAENIACGRQTATREQIVAAAKAAGAHRFIVQTEKGYDTPIGERGFRLSGGQKQRLAIARALLRDAPILILDEATGSVDVETETEIQLAIDSLAGSRTVIVIAHRLSTVRRADKILVLHEGRIIERGSHSDLLVSGGKYSRLCRAQLRA